MIAKNREGEGSPCHLLYRSLLWCSYLMWVSLKKLTTIWAISHNKHYYLSSLLVEEPPGKELVIAFLANCFKIATLRKSKWRRQSNFGNFIKDCISWFFFCRRLFPGCSVKGADHYSFCKVLQSSYFGKNSLINFNSTLGKSITNYFFIVIFLAENFV